MSLTAEQRAELEEYGAQNIRIKLTSYGGGRPSVLNGFLRCCPYVTRGDVEDWLVEKSHVEAAQQAATLRWAVIGGRWAIVGGWCCHCERNPRRRYSCTNSWPPK